MQSIKLKAFAKLNLSLNVLSKIHNGYHELKFLNCELNLADQIKIKKTDKNEIRINCQWRKNDCYDNLCPQNCLAYQAAKILQRKFPKKIKGVEISIDKKIPVRAGLGGGSTDAAEVLYGINKLYDLKLSQNKLIKIAAEISNDACYSVAGGLARVEGIGEKIIRLNNKIPSLSRPCRKWYNLFLVIVVPKIKKPSTAWAYKNLDHKKIGKNLKKFEKLLLSLKPKTYNSRSLSDRGSSDLVENPRLRRDSTKSGLKPINYLHNDFEPLIFKKFPEVKKIKDDLISLGAENAILCGSGLSVAGFFTNQLEERATMSFFGNSRCIFTRIK